MHNPKDHINESSHYGIFMKEISTMIKLTLYLLSGI